MAQQLVTQAVVLSQRAQAETDVWVSLFTAELGRLVVKARGLNSPRSKRKALVQPLKLLRVQLIARRQAGWLLGQVELEQDFWQLGQKPESLFVCWEMMELLERLLPELDPQPQIYNHLVKAWQYLLEQDDYHSLSRAFKLSVLRQLGYWQKQGSSVPSNVDDYITRLLHRPLVSWRLPWVR